MKQYNIKIADYDGNVIEDQPISDTKIIVDYLSLDKSTIVFTLYIFRKNRISN